MAAVIGSLRVDLGLNSAQFQAGLKRAQSGLGNFAKVAGVGLAGIATAAVAAGAALAPFIKSSIDSADRMGELAQSTGVSVEALTSYGYAAKMSGSDTETLATGLRKLSQNMLAVSQGSTGPVAAAFSALGISVQNANGTLRSSDQVLVDVADRFSRMEDGATKTALAVQLFGRSGATLIPFLNQGREGLAQLTAEADRLGITISGSTANAAGQFNDSLDRLDATFDGVINKVTEAALPALNRLGDTLASPEFAASAQAIGVAIVGAMQIAVDAVNTVVGALGALRSAMDYANTHDFFGNEVKGLSGPRQFIPFNTPEKANDILRDKLTSGQTAGPGADFYSGILNAPAPAAQQVQETEEVMTQLSTSLNDVATSSAGAGSGVRAMSSEVAASVPAITELERANDQLSSSLANGLANVFSSVIDGSKSATEAIGDLVKSLADMAIQEGFKWLIGGLFSGGLGGLIPGFAGGTNFAPGGLSLVGERGPELVNLPRGSQVIPNNALGSGRGMDVRISLDNALLRALVTDEAGRVVGQAAPAIVGTSVNQANKSAPGAMARYQNDQAGSDYRL